MLTKVKFFYDAVYPFPAVIADARATRAVAMLNASNM